MKKVFLFCMLFCVCLGNISFATNDIIESQKDNLKISSFIKESEKYTKDVFPEININKLFEDAIKGQINESTIYENILNLFGKEVKNTLKVLVLILIIILIHSIFKSVSENLENQAISEITYYVQYILIVTIIMSNFTEIINMAKDSIQTLVGFMYTLTPILITLMITTGSIVSANVVQPILLFAISFIGNIISNLILPIILISTVLGIVSQLSKKVQIDKIVKFFNSGVVWSLGIILTIFVGMLSLEGTLSSSVDGLTAKTTKAAVSNFIPVVGKVLGDSIDTVMGCASILKNAIGIVGVIIVIGICAMPVIKLATLSIMYNLAAALCQPIADERIVKLLEQMGGTFKILLAITFAVSIMLIIGITLVVKISNSGLMYR